MRDERLAETRVYSDEWWYPKRNTNSHPMQRVARMLSLPNRSQAEWGAILCCIFFVAKRWSILCRKELRCVDTNTDRVDARKTSLQRRAVWGGLCHRAQARMRIVRCSSIPRRDKALLTKAGCVKTAAVVDLPAWDSLKWEEILACGRYKPIVLGEDTHQQSMQGGKSPWVIQRDIWGSPIPPCVMSTSVSCSHWEGK